MQDELSTNRDIAARVDGEGRYRAIVHSALDAIIVIDRDNKICEFNPAAERVFGWTRDQVIGRDVAEVVIPEGMRQRHRHGLAHHLATGEVTLLDRRLEFIALRADGKHFPIELSVTRWGQGPDPIFTAFIRDLSEQKRLVGELAHNATHDAVTGLGRYAVLEQRLAQMLAAEAGFTAVLLIDLDRFHAINETIGHDLGDEILRTVGDRLSDFASDKIAICHFASDEFVVAMSGTSERAAVAVAEDIRKAIASPIEGEDYRVLLTATVGVSHAPAHGLSTLDLLRRAQASAERGKLMGRDCVCAFLTEHMQNIEDRVTLGGRLREAVRAGELELHYQPQFDVVQDRLAGFEALLRWNNPQLGSVPPTRFIPIAEALGLTPEIGSWVLREACRQARVWLDEGRTGFKMAVNVSPQQLQRPGLVSAVSQALRDFAIPVDMLDLELTESSLIENLTRAQETLAQLKALGVVLSLDDFGTGYSSLAYLKNFALDKLKIDQSFVRGLPDNSHDAAISRTIVSVAHELGLRVSAEGVETQAQAEFLRDIGCDELQGYLLGRPSSALTAEQYFHAPAP